MLHAKQCIMTARAYTDTAVTTAVTSSCNYADALPAELAATAVTQQLYYNAVHKQRSVMLVAFIRPRVYIYLNTCVQSSRIR
jgi:hypothetical protein